MRTHKELEAWIAANAAEIGEGTTKDKSWWFVSVQEVEEEGPLSVRERAHFFLEGMLPMSDHGVDEWLSRRDTDAYEMGEDRELWDIALVESLRRHFGLS